MIQKTKRYARRALLACAVLATAGFTLGSASEAEARGCRPYGGYGGYGGGYGAYYGGGGYGYGYAPRPVVVARPVVYAPVNYGHRAAAYGYRSGYRGGYRGGVYGGRGISIGFGF
ncbi:hypothetical protein MalM25_02650 [Planctomycetes bacterium MalM25]|nr:hypothetical protein MalM25_02650 [Planctomycetes bacterium MalM25]